MFGWFFSRRPRTNVALVEISRGARGRYRWQAYDATRNLVAMAPVQGWQTFTEALEAGKAAFPDAIVSMPESPSE